MFIKGALYAAILIALTQSARAEESRSRDKRQDLVTLDQAISWALKESPTLGASESRAEAAIAGQSQAEVLPNPEISVDVENIYGDGAYKNFAGAEITYGVSQLVELPGKRLHRIRIAEGENARVHYRRDSARLDLIRDVTIAYVEAVTAERELAIRGEERRLASTVKDSVSAKVQAGKEPVIQKNKAEIELSTSTIAYDRAQRQVGVKRQALSTLIGGGAVISSLSPESLPSLSEPEPFNIYKARLEITPDIQILEAEIGQAQAVLSLESEASIPDPTIGIGLRQIRETDNKAMVASVSFPLPVFNLNRAAITRAGHELNAIKLEQQAGVLSREAKLTQVYEDYQGAYQEANVLDKEVVPGAEQAFEYARGGYEAGKFGYLEVLDAQRTLFEARKQYNTAVLEYYKWRAEIERLAAIYVDRESHAEEGR